MTAEQTSSWRRAHDRDSTKTQGLLRGWQTSGNRNLFLFLYSNGGVNGALVKNLKALIIRVSLPISFTFIPKEVCVQDCGSRSRSCAQAMQTAIALPTPNCVQLGPRGHWLTKDGGRLAGLGWGRGGREEWAKEVPGVCLSRWGLAEQGAQVPVGNFPYRLRNLGGHVLWERC